MGFSTSRCKFMHSYAIQVFENNQWVDKELYHVRAYAIGQYRMFAGKNKNIHSRLIYIFNGNVLDKHDPDKLKESVKKDKPLKSKKKSSKMGYKKSNFSVKQSTPRPKILESDKHNPRIKSEDFCSDTDNGKCYVYAIRCKRNSCFYIGKTSNLTNRVTYHLGKLNRKSHHNVYLQNDWIKFGGHNFYMEVLETYETKEEVTMAETRLIKEYSTKCGNRLYNIAGNNRKSA